MRVRKLIIGITTLALLLPALESAAQKVQGKTHLGGAASGIVNLRVFNVSPGDDETLTVQAANGANQGELVLPAKTVFVLTDYYVEASSGVNGLLSGAVINASGTNRARFRFDTSQRLGQHFTISGGIVFDQAPQIRLFLQSDGDVNVWIVGYLAKNK